MNISVFMGRLGDTPELRTTQSGKSVCTFDLAIDSGFGENKSTAWARCVAWKSTAEFISKYFGKGSMIAVKCRYSTREYEDKNGKKQKAYEFIVDEAHFCGNKGKSENSNADINIDVTEISEDDLPF